MTLKKIGVLTSGGDSPGMNAAIRAVVRRAISKDIEVIGFRQGFRGLINNDFTELKSSTVGGIIDKGGTFLGTARSEKFKTEEGLEASAKNIKDADLDGLIVIGGEGSFRGAEALSKKGIKTVGIPATIDNDVSGSDYCIGFDTALNTALDAISKIRDTASALERVFIVEVMGRNSGMLALFAGLAGGADVILIPEIETDIDSIRNVADEGYRKGKKHTIIVVAEGFCSAPDVAQRVMREGEEHEVKYSVLGYIQRGGAPTGMDRLLASRFGAKAVDLLIDGMNQVVVGIQGRNLATVNMSFAYCEEKAIDPEIYKLAQVLAT